MTDQEYDKLIDDLTETNNRLEDLQKQYEKETGRRWVPGVWDS